MARNKKTQEEKTQPANITPLPKKKSRKRAFVGAMAETVTGDGPLIPMDPTERYAFDQLAKARGSKHQRLLDLAIAFTLLGTDGSKQFCQYLQSRRTQTDWGQTTQAA